MAEYKLNKPHPKHSNGKGYITIDGHTMLNQDIVRDLKRLQGYEKKFKAMCSEVSELMNDDGEPKDAENFTFACGDIACKYAGFH